jgi:hypothetical protein
MRVGVYLKIKWNGDDQSRNVWKMRGGWVGDESCQ